MFLFVVMIYPTGHSPELMLNGPFTLRNFNSGELLITFIGPNAHVSGMNARTGMYGGIGSGWERAVIGSRYNHQGEWNISEVPKKFHSRVKERSKIYSRGGKKYPDQWFQLRSRQSGQLLIVTNNGKPNEPVVIIGKPGNSPYNTGWGEGHYNQQKMWRIFEWKGNRPEWGSSWANVGAERKFYMIQNVASGQLLCDMGGHTYGSAKVVGTRHRCFGEDYDKRALWELARPTKPRLVALHIDKKKLNPLTDPNAKGVTADRITAINNTNKREHGNLEATFEFKRIVENAVEFSWENSLTLNMEVENTVGVPDVLATSYRFSLGATFTTGKTKSSSKTFEKTWSFKYSVPPKTKVVGELLLIKGGREIPFTAVYESCGKRWEEKGTIKLECDATGAIFQVDSFPLDNQNQPVKYKKKTLRRKKITHRELHNHITGEKELKK